MRDIVQERSSATPVTTNLAPEYRGIRQFHVPGVDSASSNEYQGIPGGKDGRCVWLTTYHLQVPMSRNLEALTSPEPSGPHRPVMGLLYFYVPEYPNIQHMSENHKSRRTRLRKLRL
jgi:hypothetical protein